MSSLNPISFPSPLASNPSSLLYSLDVKDSEGENIAVSDPRAVRAMVALMDMQAVMGGAASHWGGPSALTELWSSLHAIVFSEAKKKNKQWHELFHLVNDAGHCENALYAIKANYGFAGLTVESLKGFRSLKSPLTGHGESHLFPEGVLLSNGPLGSSIPQSQGLAMADSLNKKDRVTITTISDGACMEGEAKEALAAIPGMAKRGGMAPYVLIISDNNTKLSGRIDDQSFSMAPTFESLDELGWNVIELEEGNDLEKCFESLQAAISQAKAEPTQPVAILAKTIKGYGVKATEDSASGGHGFPLKSPGELTTFLSEIYGSGDVPREFTDWQQEMVQQAEQKAKSHSTVQKVKVQEGVSQALTDAVKKGYPVYSVSSDLPGSTGLAGFHKSCPDHFTDVGIAESNMVSVAAGLSKAGLIPVVDTFAQFGTTKGALPFLMANLSQAPMIAIFSHAGFQDAADGASHQSLNYIAMTASLPNTKVIALSTSDEAYSLIGQAVEEFAEDRKAGRTPQTYIFFLGRETFPAKVGENVEYSLGRSQTVFNNAKDFKKSVTIVAAGPLLHQALQAVEDLSKKQIGSVIVNASIINLPDVETIKAHLQVTSGNLLTVEDHQKITGMGAILTHALVEQGVELKMKSLAVQGSYGQSAYTANELYEKHGLGASAIAESAAALVN